MTTTYIRGIPGSREKELYKKHSRSFFPAFYDYVMSGTGSGDITTVKNVVGPTTSVFETNGCVERKLKRWISINTITNSSSSATIAQNVGPLYFGPVYALDVNDPSVSAVPLFDVRLTYSVSFKRLRGV